MGHVIKSLDIPNSVLHVDWVACFTLWPFYLLEKSSWLLLDSGWIFESFVALWRKENAPFRDYGR